MRSLRLAAVAALSAALAAPCPTARAEEPLFLHIRPNDAPDDALAARSRREAVWARSDARARLAIASVCTGCMKPLPDLPLVPIVPPRRHDTTEIASHSGITTAAEADAFDSAGDASAPATLLAAAGEP